MYFYISFGAKFSIIVPVLWQTIFADYSKDLMVSVDAAPIFLAVVHGWTERRHGIAIRKRQCSCIECINGNFQEIRLFEPCGEPGAVPDDHIVGRFDFHDPAFGRELLSQYRFTIMPVFHIFIMPLGALGSRMFFFYCRHNLFCFFFGNGSQAFKRPRSFVKIMIQKHVI